MPVVWEVRGGQAAMGLQQRLFLFFLLFSARLKTLSVFAGKNTCAGRLHFIYPLGSSPKRLSLLQAGKGLCHSAPKPARSKYLPLFQAKGAFLTPPPRKGRKVQTRSRSKEHRRFAVFAARPVQVYPGHILVLPQRAQAACSACCYFICFGTCFFIAIADSLCLNITFDSFRV